MCSLMCFLWLWSECENQNLKYTVTGPKYPLMEEGVTSCSPILQSGSLELIKYHWRGKAGPAFFPGSHCVLLSLRCHHTGVHTPPRLCGHQWPDNAPMCSPQCAAKKLYITKLGTKAPCDRLCLDPNISAFTINWQGLKRSFSVIICIVKYHHPMSALVSLYNGFDHLLPL